MILIGIGANLDSPLGPPVAACEAALRALGAAGISVLQRSRWYRTAPVPASDQPWYINGVASVAGEDDPYRLLAVLNRIEDALGRMRGERNAPRVIDLDLLAHGDAVVTTARLSLPHPRLHERAFVLLPLAEVAPTWRHPIIGASLPEMIAQLPATQIAEPLP